MRCQTAYDSSPWMPHPANQNAAMAKAPITQSWVLLDAVSPSISAEIVCTSEMD